MTLGWIGVNTYFSQDRDGHPRPVRIPLRRTGRHHCGDGVAGGHQSTASTQSAPSKYTVPVTVVIMVLMSILAWSQPGAVNWGLKTRSSRARTLRCDAADDDRRRLGISRVTASEFALRAARHRRSPCSGTAISNVRAHRVACHPRRTIASVTADTDPAKMVSAVFGGTTSILVLLMVLHGPIATNILNVIRRRWPRSAWASASRTALARSHRRLSGHDLHLRAVVRQGVRQLADQPAVVDEPLGRRHDGRLLQSGAARSSPNSTSRRKPAPMATSTGAASRRFAGLIAGWLLGRTRSRAAGTDPRLDFCGAT